ncbi:MAG: hypothetical protein ACE5GW_08345 [Planctomycetota bacterium]
MTSNVEITMSFLTFLTGLLCGGALGSAVLLFAARRLARRHA